MSLRFRTIPILVLSLFSLILGCESHDDSGETVDQTGLQNHDFGGDFTLTDQNGDSFQLGRQNDRVVLLFFGYTFCPDACPTTLSKLTRVYDLLDEHREQIVTAFVSLDPKRDTPEVLKKYLTYFSIPSVGLTGQVAEIDTVISRYKGYYSVSGDDAQSGYLIDHTMYVYLIDQNGKVRYLFRPEHTPEMMASLIRQLF